MLIVDPQAADVGAMDPLFQVVGKSHGTVDELFAPTTAEHPDPVKVAWAESLRLSLDYKEGVYGCSSIPIFGFGPNGHVKLRSVSSADGAAIGGMINTTQF